MASFIICLSRQKFRCILQPLYLGCRNGKICFNPWIARSASSLSNTKSNEVSSDVKPIGEKIKENTKTVSYMGVIMLGLGVTGVMFYTICKELFSPKSPNTVYTKALEKVVNDIRVQDAVGMPIKGYGEETKRRRRNHAAHSIYQRNGIEHMRMQFYIQGIRQRATVHLEMKENSSGIYDYRYLFVQLDHYPKTTIILEDNRSVEQNNQKSLTLE